MGGGRGRVLALLVLCMLAPPLCCCRSIGGHLRTFLLLGLTGLLTVLITLRIQPPSARLPDLGEPRSRRCSQSRRTQRRRRRVSSGRSSAGLGLVAGRVLASHVTDGHLEDQPVRRSTEGVEELRLPVVTGSSLVVESLHPLDPPLHTSMEVLAQNVGMTFERLEVGRRLVEEHAAVRVESLLAQSLDVVAVVDESERIQYITPAIRNLTGLDRDALVGTPVARCSRSARPPTLAGAGPRAAPAKAR